MHLKILQEKNTKDEVQSQTAGQAERKPALSAWPSLFFYL